MYACSMYVARISIHTDTHTVIQARTHILPNAYVHTYIPTYLTYIPTYLAYIPTYRHADIPTYLHTYIHTSIHTYIHTYAHTGIPT